MALYRATIDILIESDHEAEAMDGVSNMLLTLLEDDKMLDWQYATDPETGTYAKPTEISSDVAARWFDEYTA